MSTQPKTSPINTFVDAEVNNRLISASQAARLLGVSRQTLMIWRKERRGPAYYRLGENGIRYRIGDIREWFTQSRVATANPPPKQEPWSESRILKSQNGSSSGQE